MRHYYRLIEPAAAGKGIRGHAFFSRRHMYRGGLVSVERGAEVEAEYWIVARDKVFKKDAAWRKQVEKRLAAWNSH